MSSNQYDAQASTDYKEAFSLFDKRGNGRVALDSLGDLLRACGQNPTLAEIQELEKTVGGDCTSTRLFFFVFTFWTMPFVAAFLRPNLCSHLGIIPTTNHPTMRR